MTELIEREFVPARVHVRDDAEEFKRLGAQYGALWTPVILVLDAQGQERHRIQGFLPVDDFLAQLELGLGHAAFARGDFAEAERAFRDVAERYAETDAAPEALYWAGVSRYKATNDVASLRATARSVDERYPESSWSKKASVWRG